MSHILFLFTDVDECSPNSTLNDCHPFASCNNTRGSFNCSCLPGFDGDGRVCVDMNECESSPCHPNATCSNTNGSFVCNCTEGYTGSGTSCSGNASFESREVEWNDTGGLG